MAYLTGLPTLYGINPFDTQLIQRHPLGSVGFDRIGRRYRYVLNGAVATVKGHLLQSAARDTAFTDMAVQAITAIGATQIPVTLGATSATKDLFADGILAITASTGLGQNFTIQGHAAATNATTCTFNLGEGEAVLTALATSSKATASRGPYNGVVDSPTTRTGMSVGVSISVIPATAAGVTGYGWIGVEGLFAVLSDATVAAVGEDVSPSTTTAGAVTKQVTLLENIGMAPILGVSAEYQPVFFKLP